MRRKSLLLPLALAATLPFLAAPVQADAERTHVPINMMRLLGSHNSYRPELSAADMAAQRQWLDERAAAIEYGHPSIARQLDLGIRQLEFDPFADHKGGLFAAPYAGQPDAYAAMMRPGAKVLHAPVVDARSQCLTLDDCFAQVAAWSRAHRGHGLIVIFVNARETPFEQPGMPQIEPFDEPALAEIDTSAVRIFGRDRLVTPDMVRGRHPTLRAAVTHGGWPQVDAVRDKFLLVLDSSPAIAERYRTDHPSLRGRAMFAFYDETADEAAVFNIQDPIANESRATALVSQGFLVRTRADADTREARAKDYRRLDAALRTGSQIISTDYYPGAQDPLNLGFVIRLPD